MTISALLVDIQSAGKALGVGRSTVYELLAAREIEAVHIGARRLITVESIHAYVARLIEGAEPRAD